MCKNYVIFLGRGGEVIKRLHWITGGWGGGLGSPKKDYVIFEWSFTTPCKHHQTCWSILVEVRLGLLYLLLFLGQGKIKVNSAQIKLSKICKLGLSLTILEYLHIEQNAGGGGWISCSETIALKTKMLNQNSKDDPDIVQTTSKHHPDTSQILPRLLDNLQTVLTWGGGVGVTIYI